MSRVALTAILGHVFRSNPEYEFARFDRLPADQQELLKHLTNDPDFFGVLVSRTPGSRPVKSVCRDTASLLQSLESPGALPGNVQHSADEQTNNAIVQLVLDGVLEIFHGNKFVSGAEAYPLIYPNRLQTEPAGLLPRLSRSALEYGQALSMDDAAALSMRLYFYNRIPLTREWVRHLPSEESVADFLGISGSPRLKQILKHWSVVEEDAPYKPWFHWHSRSTRVARSEPLVGYKLYVSPSPEDLPAALQAVVECLGDSTAYGFKVGRTAVEILRPDKLVVYFLDFESLEHAAGRIALALPDCAVHGVPFTAAIGDSGLLSWGIDPAPDTAEPAWQDRESWRLWITNRLAAALVSARNRCPDPLQPWQFALERLRLAHIDVDTWSPVEGFGVPAA